MDNIPDTYSLRDFLMFSAETYDAVSLAYLRDIQPAPWVFGILTVAGIAAIFPEHRHFRRMLFATTGLGWLWIGLVFQRVYYSQISIAGSLLTVACLIQGLLMFAMSATSLSEIKWPLPVYKFALLGLFAVVAFCPLPGWSELPGEGTMFFGYGPTRTYLGTLILLTLPSGPLWTRFAAAVIPALSLGFQILTHIALASS